MAPARPRMGYEQARPRRPYVPNRPPFCATSVKMIQTKLPRNIETASGNPFLSITTTDAISTAVGSMPHSTPTKSPVASEPEPPSNHSHDTVRKLMVGKAATQPPREGLSLLAITVPATITTPETAAFTTNTGTSTPPPRPCLLPIHYYWSALLQVACATLTSACRSWKRTAVPLWIT